MSGAKGWSRSRTPWSHAFRWLNGEVLLSYWANCGTLIAVRAFWASCVICAVGLALANWLDPSRAASPSWRELRSQLVAGLPGFATVLAAAYAAFYARFSSQWTYVAEVYNSIKEAEYSTSDANATVLAEWKAGFIEDCEDLHLARKPSLATTIHAWGSRKDVQQAFVAHAVGGRERLSALLRVVADVAQREPAVFLDSDDGEKQAKGT